MKADFESSPARRSGSIHAVEHATLAAAVEHAADGIIVTDIRGTIQFVNPSFTAMTGFTSEEAVGRNPRILKSGAHSAAFYDEIWSTIRSGQVWRGEITNRRKDRTFYQEESRISPVQNANGQIIGYVAIKRDITERKRAQEALRESEERFRSMADSCPSMLWVTGITGKTEFINSMYREFCGITLEQAQTDGRGSLLHPEDADRYHAAFEIATRTHAPFKAEVRVRRADGEWRLVGTHAQPRFSPQGEYLGHIGLAADITERRKAQQEQQFQHSLIRAIFEGSLDGILVVDTDGIVMSHNKKLLDIWKIPPEEILEDRTGSIAGADQVSLVAAALRRAKDPDTYRQRIEALERDPEAADHGEVELKDGRTLERHSMPLRSESGHLLGRARFFRDLTERKQAEAALKETEERFRSMADGCPMPLWITDTEGEIRFVNRAFAEFCGTDFNRIVGSKWQQFLHPDDAASFTEGIFLALRERRSFKIEVRAPRHDGECRWFAAFAAPHLSPSGEFLGHVGVAADITERRQADMALQSSEEKFRQLAENIREVFWLKEPGKTDFLYVSPAYEQVFGRSRASFYQDPSSRLEAIHPHDLGPSRLVFARQDRGEAAECEYRIRTPDGEEKWIRSRAFPVLDQTGKLSRVAGIADDITQKKRDEARLIRAQSEAESANRQLSAQHLILDRERKMLRTFINNVPDLMFVKDIEGRFVIANPQVARWMGAKSPEDLIGKSDFDFYPQEIAQGYYEDEQRVARTGESMFDHEEKMSVGAANEARYLLTTKVPLFDSEGHVTGIAGIGRDITMRKAMEDAVCESNRELQEATDWANQLALDADTASQAKSEFLANMSHEIRTPMNGVLGMIGLLLGSNLETEQRHYAEVAEDSAKSLLTLIDDILDFSKIEAGKLAIDVVDFNLHVMMGDFAHAIATRLGKRQLEFICAVAPNVCPSLRGDPGRLRQVLMNLVGNAIKFTHQGEVVVRADLVSETDTAVSLRFSVRDTGIGIPKDKKQILFTSFTQVDASTTRRYGGTGLGLAISKKLVEMMGGQIGMESREGEGSEFWFTLSLDKQPVSSYVVSPHVPVKGTRILVVDDNRTNREVLAGQLQSWSAVVAAAESGQAALDSLRSAARSGSPFQVALLDMMMPDMDGAMLGAAILADSALKSTPLVMMTSLGERGDALRLKEIGFAAYLVKPVRPSDLLDCLMAILSGEQQAEKPVLITRHSLQARRRLNTRILLVEDNLTNQEVACGMLRRMGWHADVASDGKQAINALEDNPYDLVLMDVQMPEMDGYEATRIIRDSLSAVLNHNIPIIATTAHAMVGDAEKCLAAGMSDYISKPIDPKALSKVVEKWLARKVHGDREEAPRNHSREQKPSTLTPPKVSPIFNRKELLARMMGDEDFAHEIAAGFASELPLLVNSLVELVQAEDLDAIWKQAHKLKGSAANVGGDALRDVAFKIEQAGKEGDLTTVLACIRDLEAETARLSEALQQWTDLT